MARSRGEASTSCEPSSCTVDGSDQAFADEAIGRRRGEASTVRNDGEPTSSRGGCGGGGGANEAAMANKKTLSSFRDDNRYLSWDVLIGL